MGMAGYSRRVREGGARGGIGDDHVVWYHGFRLLSRMIIK